jgi:hypothetical protein
MNAQKGFTPILLILLGLIVIGGGVYFYTNSYKKNKNTNPENNIEIATTTSDQIDSVSKEDSKIKLSNLKEARYSFRISPINPAIVHPVTKAIVSKKIDITQEDLGSTGKIVSKDSDFAVIELYGHGCLLSDGYPSVFVYVSKNLTDVYGFIFGHNEKEDVTMQVRNIKSYVELNKDRPEETKNIIQTPPGDVINDGYYYVKLNDWDEKKKELKVDFLSLREDFNDEALDVLFQYVENNAGLTLNILTENKNENNRNIQINGDEAERNLKQIIEGYNLYINDYQNSPELFIKVKDGKIIELDQVNTAC